MTPDGVQIFNEETEYHRRGTIARVDSILCFQYQREVREEVRKPFREGAESNFQAELDSHLLQESRDQMEWMICLRVNLILPGSFFFLRFPIEYPDQR